MTTDIKQFVQTVLLSVIVTLIVQLIINKLSKIKPENEQS